MNILTSIFGLVAKLCFLWRTIGMIGAIVLFNCGAYAQIILCLLVMTLVLGSFWWQFVGSRRAQG